jgi:hypothetical protein
MPLTLAVTDLANSTGASAVIAGSSGGANVVYAITADMIFTSLWVNVASLTGDGTVTLALNPGYYWAYVASNVSTLSPLVYFPVTRSSDSQYNRIKLAVQAKIKTLSLPYLTTPAGSLPAAQVYEEPVINLKTKVLPCVVVSEVGLGETLPGGTNVRDDVGYPVVVSIIDRCAPDYTTPMPTYRLWRERIHRGLRRQRLPGVQDVYDIQPQPGPISDWPKSEDYQYFVSALTFRFIAREPRGI